MDDAQAAGMDGMIVPDLPTEEAEVLGRMASERGIHLIPLLAPTSSDDRIQGRLQSRRWVHILRECHGSDRRAQIALSEQTAGLVARIRRHTDLPVLVGFGVSRREHLEAISEFADGAIVASALSRRCRQSPG